MQAVIVPVTPFQQNCTLMWCPDTMEGAIVDPGGEIDRLLGIIDDQGITLVKILVTHGHIDHAGGVADLAERLGIPIEGPHKDDKFWIDQLTEQGDRFGTGENARSFTPDRWLDGGDTVSFGNVTLLVRHCPGHTPGHVIFFHEGLRVAQVGDVLFQGSIGRTDFPRGDHATLLASIKNELWPLGDDVTFIPGHGPTSTFGHERRTNPFVADS
jgi:hydroxyacylglutathione hydrolase